MNFGLNAIAYLSGASAERDFPISTFQNFKIAALLLLIIYDLHFCGSASNFQFH